MFSFRSVVEGLAHTPRRPSHDTTGHENPDVGSRSVSLDGAALRDALPASSVQFTESLSSLRKSFGPQRTGSPTSTSAASPTSTDRPAKRRLEDRLRASFAIGDASDASTPAASSRTSPAPSPTTAPETQSSASKHPISPTSVPLPQSPAVDTDSAQAALTAPRLAHPLATPPSINIPLLNSISESSALPNIPHTSRDRHPGADIPLPQSPPLEDIPQPLHVEPISPEVSSPDVPKDTTVDVDVNDAGREADEKDAGGEYERRTGDGKEEEGMKQGVSEEDVAENTLSVRSEAIGAMEKGLDEASPVNHSSEIKAGAAFSKPPGITAVSSRPQSNGEATPDSSDAANLEAIRERLRLVEQRFSDVSTSFKRLQAEKFAADKLLQELTSVQSIQDVNGLRDFLQNSQIKVEMSQDEIKRLNGKLTRQDERIEELRETHRLESRSQINLIDRLRKQVEEAEALIKANHDTSSRLEAEVAKHKAELDHSHKEIERQRASTKDEEEKRTKAVALLKTVRTKLTKAEKERDDAVKELASVKDKEQAERDKDKSERINLQNLVEQVKAEKESALSALQAQHEREFASLKEYNEKELVDLRSQFDLETATTKSEYDQVVAAKNTRISGLEYSVQTLTMEKNSLFDQVQLRQAEVESSQSHLEVLQSQNTELQYQLRESDDRVALLTEELTEARRDQTSRTRSPVNPAEDVARLLANAESRHETKLAELRRKLAAVEAERTEVEADWSRKLDEKVKEAEKWRLAVDSSSRNQQNHNDAIEKLRAEIDRLKQEARSYRNQVLQLQLDAEQHAREENGAKEEVFELNARLAALAQQVEDAKAKESQARALNKTLREELRKVQSSAALLERQRNPGVGYWGSRQESQQGPTKPTSPPSSVTTSRGASPTPGPPAGSNEEEVNLEYLRNVILQFLEHKEMRPNLVRVLSIILHFTPQETRRLIAKV